MHPHVSKESYLTYYKTFVKSSFNLKFILGYTDLKLTQKYKPYMKDLFGDKAFTDSINLQTGDIYYGYDHEINQDSAGYYQKRIDQGVFADRIVLSEHLTNDVTDKEIRLLKTISEILEKHGTDYKIIISPLYDQVPLASNQKNLLYTYFDKNSIFDFSGKNKFTENQGYYYESSHYRPIVAKGILYEVFTK